MIGRVLEVGVRLIKSVRISMIWWNRFRQYSRTSLSWQDDPSLFLITNSEKYFVPTENVIDPILILNYFLKHISYYTNISNIQYENTFFLYLETRNSFNVVDQKTL